MTTRKRDQSGGPVVVVTGPSTTFVWKQVRIEQRSAPLGGQRAKHSTQASLVARDPRQPLSCVVKARGGSEAWVEIRTRGVTFRFPGWLSVCDVVDALSASRYR
jgi:hypothetical protein